MPFDGQMRTGFVSLDDMLLDMVELSFAGGKNWRQGDFARGNRRCLMEAIVVVRWETQARRDRVIEYLARAIRNWNLLNRKPPLEGGAPQVVVAFNDAHERTFADIVEVIRHARELTQVDAYIRADGRAA
jgi:hypothetical protein